MKQKEEDECNLFGFFLVVGIAFFFVVIIASQINEVAQAIRYHAELTSGAIQYEQVTNKQGEQ